MRISTAALRQSDARMFTLVVQGLKAAGTRTAERCFSIPLSQMQTTLRMINQQGGRLLSVTPADQASAAPTPAPAPTAANAAPAPVTTPVKHEAPPVNLYKPKNPFVGTVLGNYSLLSEGAIGRVNHIPMAAVRRRFRRVLFQYRRGDHGDV